MHSQNYYQLCRQVARRRRDLLRHQYGRNLIYPASGQAWIPTNRDAALCESFIVLFVAELETYLEYVVNAALDAYQDRFIASGLAECGAAKEYCSKIIERRKQWSKNNNANWARIEDFFIFVGLRKSLFPDGLWDDIDVIVTHRGDIAHNSGGVRIMTDPRITIGKIEKCFAKLKLFDRDYLVWICAWAADIERLKWLNVGFTPGLGSISTK